MRIVRKQSCKIAVANPHRPPAAGGSAPRPPLFFNTKDLNTPYSSCFNFR